MADLVAVAGAKIFIGGQLESKATDFVEADFDLQTWDEIDGWETMGSVGDTAASIVTSLINRGRDLKQKGTRNAGSMENNFAIIQGDAGQQACIAAEKTPFNYAFKIEFDDMPSGGVNPTTLWFVALVMTANETGGQANSVRMFQITLDVNSNVVNKAAA